MPEIEPKLAQVAPKGMPIVLFDSPKVLVSGIFSHLNYLVMEVYQVLDIPSWHSFSLNLALLFFEKIVLAIQLDQVIVLEFGALFGPSPQLPGRILQIFHHLETGL